MPTRSQALRERGGGGAGAVGRCQLASCELFVVFSLFVVRVFCADYMFSLLFVCVCVL